MSAQQIGAWVAFLMISLVAVFLALRANALGVPAEALLPAIVAGRFVPLAVPRVGAELRRVFGAKRARGDADSTGDRDADARVGSRLELARRNAVLIRELQTLKTAYAELVADTAARAEAADRLNHLAHHDALTTLPNRLLLMDRLAQAMVQARRNGTGVLVIFLDLDRFKAINDTMGHAAGDRVLREVGLRLAACMRTSDTASRVGGDEFVLVCPTADAAADSARIRTRLVSAIGAPIDTDGTSITIGVSIGMSVFPGGGSTAAELIDKADAAMYCSKLRGRSSVSRFDERVSTAAQSAAKQRGFETRRYDTDERREQLGSA